MKIETTNIQSVFVVAKGSVPVKSGKKRKLEAEDLSASDKKTNGVQMIIASNDSSSPSGLIWDGSNYSCAYVQFCMKSGQLTQRLGQEDSRKSTSTISSHYLPVSKNI